MVWADRTGAWLGDGNDSNYNHTDCFGKFPFPACTAAQQARIRELAEALDAHRKRQQAAHPGLTMTGMYNVLEKLRGFERGRAGAPVADARGSDVAREPGAFAIVREPGALATGDNDRVNQQLTAKEKAIHEQGLVSVLKQIHDDLDAAVAEAYGWPVDLSDEEILERLVALNKERAAEEACGVIRWLRPDYQQAGKGQDSPRETKTQKPLVDESELEAPVADAPGSGGKAAKIVKRPWPAGLAERFQAVRSVLAEGRPLTAYEVSRRFTRELKDRRRAPRHARHARHARPDATAR